MKKQDEFGEPLCQSVHEGIQCEGHTYHIPGKHFANLAEGEAKMWTDDGKVETGSVEYFINGRCGKY